MYCTATDHGNPDLDVRCATCEWRGRATQARCPPNDVILCPQCLAPVIKEPPPSPASTAT